MRYSTRVKETRERYDMRYSTRVKETRERYVGVGEMKD